MEQRNFNCGFVAEIDTREALRKISEVPHWWGVAFAGSAEKQGNEFTVRMGVDSFFNFTVIELTAKRVVWLVTDCHMPWYADKKEWAGTKIIFALFENELHFTHEGLTPELDCYTDCESGWLHWIRTSLFSYLTSGKGQLKTKKHTSYSTSIEVPLAPDIVFAKINDVAKWWPETVEGPSTALHDEFVFRTGDVHISKQQITELVPDQKVVWLTTESLRKTDNYEWTGARMSFELKPAGNSTTVTYTYDGPVFENEYDRLVQVSDAVIKDNLYNFLVPKVIFGNHASVLVPFRDREDILKFYVGVLGGRVTRKDAERDFICLGDFYIAFLYADVPDASEFLRSARSIWLELKSARVAEMSQKILDSGLARKLDIPDPHLYFQAPGGQCLRLVGTHEDMSFYEGTGDGPDVAKVKAALKN